MRVGLIIYGSIDTITGGYIYDKKLIDYLHSQGVTVKIFSQPYKNFFGLIKNNFSHTFIKEIIEFSPDILLQDEMNFLSLFLLNKKIKNIATFPIISIIHLLNSKKTAPFFLKYCISKIEKLYLKSIDGFVFNSFNTKDSVVSRIGDIKNYLVAQPGKDRFSFDDAKGKISDKNYSRHLMIIFIGNLTYNKGLHLLLRALSKIDYSLWRLSIIGSLGFDLRYTHKIMKMINRFGIIENVKVLGQLNAENLKEELISHHVLVVPSYYESFGIVYAEAMGAGLPVIACKLGGAQEIVADNVNGFLVTPGDVATIRNSIFKLIENRELLVSMSLSSLSAYESLPSWDETMDRVYKFLYYNFQKK